MEKEINIEWMQELLNNRNNNKNEYSGDLPVIDWVSNPRAFKKDLKFKLLPANSAENKVFGFIVGTHWLNHNGVTTRFVCPEETQHLKKAGVKCPVCEMKRKLLKQGFTENDLTVQGKFGPIPVFAPKITSNVKVVVIDSDVKHDWDKAHVSVLQQNGSFLTTWLVEKYIDKDTPNLLEWNRSNIIRFSRATENGRFEREITFSCFEPTEDVIEALKEENEALNMPDLWKLPSDQDILKVTEIAEEMAKEFIEAKKLVEEASSVNDDDIPF
jgi:hypothetical protein